MEEKRGKISVSTFILTILLILAITAITILSYINFNTYKEKDEMIAKNENLENKLSNLENENNNLHTKVEEISKNEGKKEIQNQAQTNDNININEKVVVYDDKDDNGNKLFYAYIDEGTLYYSVKIGDGVYDNSKNSEFTKYNNIINFKKMFFWNEGTSVNPTVIALTEDGKIYQFNIYKCFMNASKKIEEVSLLGVTKDINNVDDFKLEGENSTLYLKLNLKDGSEKKVILYQYP